MGASTLQDLAIAPQWPVIGGMLSNGYSAWGQEFIDAIVLNKSKILQQYVYDTFLHPRISTCSKAMYHPTNRQVTNLAAWGLLGQNLGSVFALSILPHFNALMPELLWVCCTFWEYSNVPEMQWDRIWWGP